MMDVFGKKHQLTTLSFQLRIENTAHTWKWHWIVNRNGVLSTSVHKLNAIGHIIICFQYKYKSSFISLKVFNRINAYTYLCEIDASIWQCWNASHSIVDGLHFGWSFFFFFSIYLSLSLTFFPAKKVGIPLRWKSTWTAVSKHLYIQFAHKILAYLIRTQMWMCSCHQTRELAALAKLTHTNIYMYKKIFSDSFKKRWQNGITCLIFITHNQHNNNN